ncbi:MAG TPA: glycosyltransferase family 4 protein [Devosiaceae bacterium]|jgi:glycosyltransferase involved in cell wall biosynthesis
MAQPPLRILQILRAPIGGLFRHVIDLTQELAARGHQIGIVSDSLSSDALTAAKLDLLSASASLGVHSFPMPRVLGWGDVSTPLNIRALADRLDISVLHGHGAKGGMSARLARIGSRRAALYTPHGGTLHFKAGSLSGKVFRLAERMLMPQTDALIFESEFARRAYVETICDPACPHPVIHNGLAEPEFVPSPADADAADFIFIGELRALKGVSFLIEAFTSLRRADGSPATLVIVGDGPDRAQFEQMMKDAGLSERVIFTGAQPARKMFSRGRCVVVPSLAESLPYIVLEASAALKPVIATAVGGVGEIFGPTSAALIKPANTTALQQAMQTFLDKPDEAARLAETRLQFIRQGFSVEVMTDAIEALYRQTIDRRSP